MPWSTGGLSKSPMPPGIWLLREHRHTRQPTSPLRSSGLDRLQVRRAKQATPLHQKSLAAKLFVQSCRGCPRVRAPVGFQSNTRLTHRFAGKFATCIANFQWCLRHCSDQAFNPCCCASATGLPFQWCRISCQGAFHSTILGGPTIIRSILRKNNVQFVQVTHPDCSMARSKEDNRCNDPVNETKSNCKTNLLVTENLSVGKECPWGGLKNDKRYARLGPGWQNTTQPFASNMVAFSDNCLQNAG